jgi:hypothetical protein
MQDGYKRLYFGVGIVLTLLVIAGTAWHFSRPKPWDEDAIRTSFDGFYYIASATLKLERIGLRYIVVNGTGSDYILSPERQLVVLHKEALDAHPTFQFGGRFVIPPGRKMMVEILAPPTYNTGWDVDGFVAFDPIARYKVVFGRPGKPTPEDNPPEK